MGGFAANVASHWWIILIIVLLVFGATRLPQLARGVGQSINILKKEVKSSKDDPNASEAAEDVNSSTTESRSNDQQ
ncbi:twin-arginine translocase TatA/TatE family subunit [uncultured Agrococcus sp.]|uniref:Sec-independent protein translocase subunit TatA/TatB n=1 Tax=uncultured Agrococcus sp. TaxID=382258 RepID=UPI0025DAFE98|nr:twin-arginine translocase TatA/TatE family subunit [uncultured Agrococcus sp.]